MHPYSPTILSAADHARLQNLMCTMIGSRSPLASLLRRKLGSAAIVHPSATGSDVVAAGRRVRFSIDGERPEERVVTWRPLRRGDTTSLSLQAPRGLALLGLAPGQSIAYETDNRRTEFIAVEQVAPGTDDRPARSAPGSIGAVAGQHAEPALL